MLSVKYEVLCMNKELLKHIEAVEARLEKERLDYMQEQGMDAFWKAPIGTTVVKLLPEIPRTVKSKYGVKEAFKIEVDGKIWDWPINPRSPMYGKLNAGLRMAPVEFQLVRVGEGQATRYDMQGI